MGKENVETVIPLLPMQQGFLWHSLSSDNSSGEITLRCTLNGRIELQALQQAWQQVVNAHQALRSSVHWKKLSRPVQIVHANVTARIDIEHHDRSATDTDPGKQIQFTLENAPAHHLKLNVLDDKTCQVEWSSSHILLDGWSCSIVINQWLQLYSDMINARPALPIPSLPLINYGKWLQQQDNGVLVDFWLGYVPAEVPLTTPLPYRASPDEQGHSTQIKSLGLGEQTLTNNTSTDDGTSTVSAEIDAHAFATINSACKRAGISLNTILQAMVALAVTPVSRRGPVVLGTTVSGRQVNLPGIETLVGMAINLIPVPVHINLNASIRDWLTEHQGSFFSCLPYAHVQMHDLMSARSKASKAASGISLNCLLVLENQPVAVESNELSISEYRSGIISSMDLTLTVIPGNSLSIHACYQHKLFTQDSITKLLERLTLLLHKLPEHLELPVSVLDNYRCPVSTAPAASYPQKVELPSNSDEASDPWTPDTLLVQQLQNIWADIFGHPVTPDQGFFDLGGSSLQALSLFNLIEKQMDVRLSPTALFTSPTIRKLAADIGGGQGHEASSDVVLVNTHGSKMPLFLPFEQSDMFMYRHLIAELGEEQPVYGLQTTQTPLQDATEIEALANTILRLQPEGPYQLAGLSGSGLSAWLIGQRLRTQGHEVHMLALLDSYGPAYPKLHHPGTLAARVGLQLAKDSTAFLVNYLQRRMASTQKPTKRVSASSEAILMPSPFAQQLNDDHKLATRLVDSIMESQPTIERLAIHAAMWLTRVHVRSFDMKMEFLLLIQGLLLQHCDRHGINPLSIEEAVRTDDAASRGTQIPDHANQSQEKNDDALQRFLTRYRNMYAKLQPYEGKLVYIAAKRRPAVCKEDDAYGWSKLIPADVRLHESPGAHQDMLKPPHVQYLANVLTEEMAQINTLSP